MTSILKADTIQDTDGNNIINESGNTITIGASGDTTNIIGTLQNNGSAVSSGLTSTQVFTSSGTWTKPSGITKVRVYVTGGGGAGGTAIELIDVSSVSSVTVTIGSGGSGSSGAAGGDGGTSSFGSYCSATGGKGGVVPGAFNYAVTGGLGSGGDINLKGQGGGGAFEDQGGALVSVAGGNSFWGGGGDGIWSGTPGAGATGGGGSGDSSNNSAGAGANGGDGIVYVEEYA